MKDALSRASELVSTDGMGVHGPQGTYGYRNLGEALRRREAAISQAAVDWLVQQHERPGDRLIAFSWDGVASFCPECLTKPEVSRDLASVYDGPATPLYESNYAYERLNDDRWTQSYSGEVAFEPIFCEACSERLVP